VTVVPQVSVCILAGHERGALDSCLRSLRRQQSPPQFEVLVGGRDPDPDVVRIVHRHFPEAPVCDTGGRLPGAARNPLIERARGQLLLFLDDDVTAPPDLLRTLAQVAAAHPEASVFGGPNATPPGSSRFQAVQGAVLSSLVGSGPVSRRYGARHGGPADERWFTLCNLAVRRRAMVPFLTHLVCAEENALLAELRRRGERMRYEPALRVHHVRRPTVRSFARQMVKYGRGRGQVMARRPSTTRLAYLAPSALLVYLALVPAAFALSVPAALALAPATAYAVLVCASGLRIGRSLGRMSDAPLAWALTLVVHLCYGAGVLRGLVRPGRARHDRPGRWMPEAERAAGPRADQARAKASA
jgi:succinoglycan biosynthesis protein ExoA